MLLHCSASEPFSEWNDGTGGTNVALACGAVMQLGVVVVVGGDENFAEAVV